VRKSVGAAEKSWRTTTPAETEAVGAKLAAALPAQRKALTVVYLTGDLGAGKTTLARGFLRALGIVDVVRSPTYTLLETYESAAGTVTHLDLYRLRDASELEALGLRDFARSGNVWLVEWAERGAGVLPAADLNVLFTIGSDTHDIMAQSSSELGESWIRRIAA
jgi:tRNA threonylcarbamoyladenosine biosynthesis protein TsaE